MVHSNIKAECLVEKLSPGGKEKKHSIVFDTFRIDTVGINYHKLSNFSTEKSRHSPVPIKYFKSIHSITK